MAELDTISPHRHILNSPQKGVDLFGFFGFWSVFLHGQISGQSNIFEIRNSQIPHSIY